MTESLKIIEGIMDVMERFGMDTFVEYEKAKDFLDANRRMKISKIWILYGVDAHDRVTLGVYDSLSKAERAREFAEVEDFAYMTIVEHPVE